MEVVARAERAALPDPSSALLEAIGHEGIHNDHNAHKWQDNLALSEEWLKINDAWIRVGVLPYQNKYQLSHLNLVLDATLVRTCTKFQRAHTHGRPTSYAQ